jgi:hypothetical protein
MESLSTSTAYPKSTPRKTTKFNRRRWCGLCGGTGFKPVGGPPNFTVARCECVRPHQAVAVPSYKMAQANDR